MAGALVAALLAGAFLLLRGTKTNPAQLFPRGGSDARDDSGQRPGTGIEDPALMLDLAAAMLEAGQPLLQVLGILADVADPGTSACLRRVQSALQLGAPWTAAWELAAPGPGELSGPAEHLREALRFVATTGAPSAAVLLAEAAQIRRRRAREAERRAAALGVRLVVPLGLCALPAFVALTVVPLLLSLLPAFP